MTFWIGCSRTGSLIPEPAAFPGGGFSDVLQSSCGSSKPTGDGGPILRRIYLKAPKMIGATCYIGFVGDVPVAHVAFSTRQGFVEARACRLVVMPEWQVAGVGMRFLNAICAAWRRGQNRYGQPMTLFHTSHPGLAAALRRDRCGPRCRCDSTGKVSCGLKRLSSHPAAVLGRERASAATFELSKDLGTSKALSFQKIRARSNRSRPGVRG